MAAQPAAACPLTPVRSGPNAWGTSAPERAAQSPLLPVFPTHVRRKALLPAGKEGGRQAHKLESETKMSFFLDSFLLALKSQTSLGNRIYMKIVHVLCSPRHLLPGIGAFFTVAITGDSTCTFQRQGVLDKIKSSTQHLERCGMC